MREHDLIVRNGRICDGAGGPPFTGDVAVDADVITAVTRGPAEARSRQEVDAAGLAVAPGFINMLSWANASLLVDGRSMSDILQGVTLEIMGEGSSMGPLSPAMALEMRERQGDLRYDIPWTTLSEYLDHLASRGVSCNVASFVGATTVRVHALGHQDRAPMRSELRHMRTLVEHAMGEGAVGLSSALIYAPACYAQTDELVALAEVVGTAGGLYISHIRDEGNGILGALDELFAIARQARVRAEIYHLKLSGPANWRRLDEVVAHIERAQNEGLEITADMYPYPASSTGLNVLIPPWAHEGGHQALMARLRDGGTRGRIRSEMAVAAPERILLVGFKQGGLKPLIGRTLAEVAAARRATPEETVMDLITEDDSRVQAVYFTMSEDNVRRQIALPWVSFGSDGQSLAAEGVFLRSGTHPRAYGTFARVVGHYARDEGIIPLEEAVRRMTSLPANTLRLDRRGLLREGYYADIVVFDPQTIADRATFEQPHQYAVGVEHVFVNGIQVVRDGSHTGATPGRVIRGPGA